MTAVTSAAPAAMPIVAVPPGMPVHVVEPVSCRATSGATVNAAKYAVLAVAAVEKIVPMRRRRTRSSCASGIVASFPRSSVLPVAAHGRLRARESARFEQVAAHALDCRGFAGDPDARIGFDLRAFDCGAERRARSGSALEHVPSDGRAGWLGQVEAAFRRADL